MGTFRDGRQTTTKRSRGARQSDLPEGSQRHLTAQGSVIAWRQLRGDGLTPKMIEARRDAGVLRALPGRVLTTIHGRIPRESQRWAAVLAAGPTARLAGKTALALHGVMERDAAGPTYVLVEGGTPRKTAGVIARRTKEFDADDLCLHANFPTTTVARALRDAAEFCSSDELAGFIDRAVMLGRYDDQRLNTLLASPGRYAGHDTLVAAMASMDEATGRFRSEFERRTKELVRTSTVLPAPLVNVLVDGYRPDFHFPGTAAIVECDGRDYHRSTLQVIADGEREEFLIKRGWAILRLRWADVVYEPAATLARIEAFVLEHRLPPTPGGLVLR